MDTEDPQHQNYEESYTEFLIRELRKLSEEERLKAIRAFCNVCGADDPECQCWNDE